VEGGEEVGSTQKSLEKLRGSPLLLHRNILYSHPSKVTKKVLKSIKYSIFIVIHGNSLSQFLMNLTIMKTQNLSQKTISEGTT
jgi:hypothetical protein